MIRLLAYCKACGKKIDITTMPFVGYADEDPWVLDVQLGESPTEDKAIEFVIKHHPNGFQELDNDGHPSMYHYGGAEVSHMEAGDEVHTLEVSGGHWSPL